MSKTPIKAKPPKRITNWMFDGDVPLEDSLPDATEACLSCLERALEYTSDPDAILSLLEARMILETLRDGYTDITIAELDFHTPNERF